MNSEIMGLLTQAMGGETPRRLGNALGMDEGQAGGALAAAVPMLLAGLAKNTQSEGGASALLGALSRDHDGGALDDLGGLLGGLSGGAPNRDGLGILGHVLGGRQPQAQNALAQTTGIRPEQAMAVLAAAAPLVMAAVGRTQRKQGLDANGLSSLLGQERSALAGSAPDVMGLAGRVLDSDGDGDVDVADLGGLAGTLGKLFGSRG